MCIRDRAMTEADVAELKAAQEKLTQSAQKVFAKMYDCLLYTSRCV